MEIDKVKNSKNSSDEDKCWRVKLLDNKVHYKATIIQTMWFLQKDILKWASLVAQTVEHLPAVRETQVRSLGWEDPLEKEMATHSSILAWRIPWTEEPGGLQSTGSQRVGHD